MLIRGVDYPEELTRAIKENKLVVFVGAGVSVGKPTKLPSFTELVHYIADETEFSFDEKTNHHDSFLGKLEHNGIDVKWKTAEYIISKKAKPNELHKSIINLFGTKHVIRIVTTNYDHMLEKTLKKKTIPIHNTPALPLGNDFEGIVHIHGNQSDPKHMILTDSDFGNAYLLEGYATRFLSKLFSEYTVLLIGYSYGDTVMTYLSRALPDKQSKKRFILTDDNEKAWDMLGIIPILFPQNNYKILYESVKEYGSRINRNMVGWRNKCIELSSKLPLSDLEGTDEIKELLSNSDILALFLDNLGDKNYNEWMEWFRKNGYLDFVTEDRNLDDLDLLMCDWLIRNDIQESKLEKITLFIFERNNQINRNFGLKLLQNLYYENDNICDEVYTKSIILFGNLLREIPKFQLLKLMECCLKRDLKYLALNIFKIVMEPIFKLKKSFRTLDKAVMYEGIYDNQNESYFLRKIWETHIMKNIDYYANNIVFILADLMEKRQIEFELFNKVKNPYDVDTLFKDIETEIDNSKNKSDSIFICKMILDALTHISIYNDISYRNIINRFINSPSYTLRRIALISLRKNENFDSNDKIKIVISKFDLYEVGTKTEIFRFVADVFNHIELGLQNEILFAVLKRIDTTNNEDARSRNYSVYNWLVYLIKKNSENKLLKDTYEKHLKLFAGFKPREHPELSITISGATWMEDKSPITIEQLKLMNVNEIYKFIEGYKDDNDKFETSISKTGLLKMISELTAKDFKLNRELIEEYINHNNYASETWRYILKDLGKNDFNKKDAKFILDLMITKELILNHGIIISDLLKDLIDNNTFFDKYYKEFEKSILQIINLLYSFPTYNIMEHESVVMVAINGTIGNTILSLLSIINKRNIADEISFEYKKIIMEYLKNSKDKELVCIVAILLGYYRVLYTRDKLWVKSDIFPFLKSTDSKLFQSAWEGMLTFSPTIYADVATSLHDYYYAAIERIGEFNSNIQKSFVDSLTILLMYSVPNPNKEFIPRLFTKIDSELRCVFLEKVCSILENMSMEERDNVWKVWLYKFISNIRLNIPITLESNELNCIIEWLPYTGLYFPKIVDFVFKFKPIKFDNFYSIKRFLDLIREDQQYNEFDISKIHLLIYILKCKFDILFFEDEIKKFYDSLTFKNQDDREEIISLALNKLINL